MRWIHRLCLLLFLMCLSTQASAADCGPTEFTCGNGRCINIAWKCDGEDDCRDHSDEVGCGSKTCADEFFQCDDGQCIPDRWVCDDLAECKDGSDEKIEMCNNRTCAGHRCNNSDQCISGDWKCDGHPDCPDGDDEIGCSIICDANEFQCLDKKCVSVNWKCDGHNDCEDGSDEKDCPKTKCEEGEKMCRDEECINELWWCDGYADCKDKSDEVNCSKAAVNQSCSTNEFQCRVPTLDVQCIHLGYVCDGDEDCTDGSDELNCPDRTCNTDEKMCGKNLCIKLTYFCDGEMDCDDGEDEKYCNQTHVSSICKDKEFDCGNGKCISDQMICNSADDCGNGADESPDRYCPVQTNNICGKNNGGCSQVCVPNTHEESGRICECHVGFDLVNGSETECEDIDECKIAGACSQVCTNTKGSYKCECFSGYTLTNHRYCKATDGKHAELILSDRHNIRRYHLDTSHYSLLLEQNASGAVAMDFDIRNKVVFWADAQSEKIFSASLETNETKVIVEENILMPDGLAIDWIHGNLYLSDTGLNKIEVSRLDGSHRKILVDDNLDEPRALALDPNNGWMYWTDWGNQPKIEKCGMNGQHRKEIRTHDIAWPNGLTIDYVQNRLYWVDAKLHIIGSSDLDGNNYKLILRNHRNLGHPFAITVFEDYLYWTDWMSSAVHRVSKFGHGNVSNVAKDLKLPMDIHVYHIYRQPSSVNRCGDNNGGCSHLCLPAPQLDAALSVRSECHCPDNMILDGQFSCVISDQPVVIKKPLQPVSNGSDVNRPLTRRPVMTSTTSSSSSSEQSTAHTTSSSSSSSEPSTAHTEQTTEPEDTTTKEATVGDTQVKSEHTTSEGAGLITAIVIGILAVVGIVVSLVVYMVVKRYRSRNVKTMNFDNPAYNKTTDQLIMDKDGRRGSRSSLPQSLQPLNQDSDIV